MYGNVIVGPTAEDVKEKEVSQVSTDADTAEKLIKWSQQVFPALKKIPVIGTYAGLRPATEYKDYQIKDHKKQ